MTTRALVYMPPACVRSLAERVRSWLRRRKRASKAKGREGTVMPPAARIMDMHVCPKVEPGPVPHVGGAVIVGEATVLIGYQPAARVGDKLTCVGPPDSISQGEPSVLIGNKEAARLGDSTAHGGILVAGCPTVLIGSSPQAETLKTDKPFCEECERKKKEREAKRKRRESQ